jgi:hypothetical protein
MAGRLPFQLAHQVPEACLRRVLRLRHAPLQGVGDVLPERDRLVQAEPAHDAAGDPLRLVGRPPRPPRRRGRGGRGARAQPHDRRQHLPRDARGPLPHALQDHLGQGEGGEVLARGLVHDLHVMARSDQEAQSVQGHVAPGVGVVELPVPVAPHHPRHAPNLMRRVTVVNA